MSLVTGRRSSLNPNAPLFVPAAMREVEDFSPEWWDLVNTSTWFKDYWLNQQLGENVSEVVNRSSYTSVIGTRGPLPDSIYLDVDDDIWDMETQFEEFLQSSETIYEAKADRELENGFGKNRDAVSNMGKQRGMNSRGEAMNNWEKQDKHVSARYGPRFIQQPH